MPHPTPVLVICGLDATDQEVVAADAVCDVPGAAVVRVEVDGVRGRVGWTVSDLTGVVERESRAVTHPCVSCSMREAILPALVRLARSGRWDALVLSLPPAAEPMPTAVAITGSDVDGRPAREWLDLRAVLAVVSSPDLCAGVYDDVLLDERGLALIPHDRRSYAEALLGQVEYADHVVLRHAQDPCDLALLDHLRRPGSTVHDGLGAVPLAAVLRGGPHDVDAARRFVDPRRRRPTGAPDTADVVTVHLTSWKAFHPARLMDRLEQLGSGDLRGRGAFWLPGRPGLAVAWEACGDQLSIGRAGDWGDAERATTLVVTTDPDTAADVAAAFEDALMTDAEMIGARLRWTGRPDGFEDWLDGEEPEVA